MKKLLTGLLCVGLFLFTSVSFASDGPQTTKDCVIDNLDVMETSGIVYEVEKSGTNVSVVKTNCINCADESKISKTSNDVVIFAELRDNRQTILEDYGVRRSNNFITDRTTKSIAIGYPFTWSDNQIRKL